MESRKWLRTSLRRVSQISTASTRKLLRLRSWMPSIKTKDAEIESLRAQIAARAAQRKLAPGV